MGTNYYWDQDPCFECGRADRLHICKSYSMFEGHFKGDEPWLTSWQQWKAHLLAGGTIRDEYDQVHTTEAFIAQVEAVKPEHRRRHYDWLVDRWHIYGKSLDKVEPGCDWLCPDGFSFVGGDFS